MTAAAPPRSPSPVCCRFPRPGRRACAGSSAPPPPRRRCSLLGEPGSGRSTLARALHGASAARRGPSGRGRPRRDPQHPLRERALRLPRRRLHRRRAGERGAGGPRRRRHARPRPRRGAAARRRSPSSCAWSRSAATRRWAARRRRPTSASSPSAPRTSRGAWPAETFRPDLFYRLEVLAFRVPPLRERRADLPAVLDHLLADLGERFGVRDPDARRRAPAPGCWSTPGRATCASSATSSSAA